MTTTTSSSSPTSDDELPPGFYLGGEFVELGPFDPTDPELEPIRACEEIPEEVLAKAGLGAHESEQIDNFGMTGCTTAVGDSGKNSVYVTLTGGLTTLAEHQSRDINMPTNSRTTVPNLLVYQFPEDENLSCRASVDTGRGIFMVAAADYSRSKTVDTLCSIAISTSESLYKLLRGEQFNVENQS